MNAPITPQRLVATVIERLACKTTNATLLEQETEIAGLKSALAKLQGEYRGLAEATQSLIEEGVCPFDHHRSHPCLFCKAKTHAQTLLNPHRPSGQ